MMTIKETLATVQAEVRKVVLGQDEASSDVYGMNKAAFVEGHVDRQFGLPDAAAEVTRQIHALARRAEKGGCARRADRANDRAFDTAKTSGR